MTISVIQYVCQCTVNYMLNSKLKNDSDCAKKP